MSASANSAHKFAWLASAIIPCFAATPLKAQDQEGAGTSTTISEIIVTARKREESALDVPVAVTALTSADLARVGAVGRPLGIHVPTVAEQPREAIALDGSGA